MARWRTHHKRAARVRRHDDKMIADIEEALALLTPQTFENACKAMADGMAKALTALSVALQAVCQQVATDPRWKSAPRRKKWEWPEVVLEDILDAEFVG